jgi:DNA adenine methylase
VMRKEGFGDIAPDIISRPIPPLYQALLKSETDRRQDRDNGRADAWGKGFLPNAHELGTIAQAVMCQYMDVPLDLTHVHDGGVDFKIHGVPVQAKATFKLDTPAIRGCELDTNKLYLLSKVSRDLSSLDIFGYCDGLTFIRHKKQKILPSGPDNWQIDSKFLRSAEEMKNVPKPKNTLRYPGGKTTMMGQLSAYVPSRTLFDSGFEHYIELFVGGGAMLFELMSRGKSWSTTVLNDLDVSLMAIYEAARDYPQELKRKIINCTPSVELWNRSKEIDGKVENVIEAAAAKLVLHYCSHAGLGYMSGSAQGGKTQESKYPIGCRWNPLKICRAIDELNGVLTHGYSQLHSRDFSWVLENAMPDPMTTFIFADPPYVEAGEQLYRHAFTEEDHERLAEAFHRSDARWLLTYDDCQLIRDLYPDNIVYAFPATSGNNHVRKHGELVIAK